MAAYLNRAARASKRVLVPAAHSLGHIAVIRALGRAGYQVHAVADRASALGLQSRFARKHDVHPPVGGQEFKTWFANYVRKYAIDLVICNSELCPSRLEWLNHYADILPLSQDAQVLRTTDSKHSLFSSLRDAPDDVRANLPPVVELDLEAGLPTLGVLRDLGSPLFIKLDRAHARHDEPDEVRKCATAEETLSALRGLAAHYRAAVVQGYAEGQGVGAFLLRRQGETIARFMHRRVHEVPHTGGASSLRQSWWHEEIMQDAERKLAHLGWEGPAMVEYRWNSATNQFQLMEINFRFWGSLHLALHAGVDFPTLLADHFFFGRSTAENQPKPDVVCRCLLPAEWGYLRSLWRDPDVGTGRKVHALYEALRLTLDPRVKSDLLLPGDRGLFYRRMGAFTVDLARAALARAGWGQGYHRQHAVAAPAE